MFESNHLRSGPSKLVLTRHPHQSILIGDDIEVTVLAIGGNTVRLRISCERLDPPVREETLRLDDIVRINEQAQVQVVMLRPEGGRVPLGVNAPREVNIAREEVKHMAPGGPVNA
jgi:sRNA-binding carbon storage regulator CsrA